MKKIILLICLTATVYSQNIDESQVPAAVKTNFAAMYSGKSDVKWEMENGKYEAEFTENKVETSVMFESTGDYVQTEVEIPVSSLPEAISKYVSSNLGGKKINEATKITTNNSVIKYEIGIKNTDYLFDENGGLLGSETEKNDTDDLK